MTRSSPQSNVLELPRFQCKVPGLAWPASQVRNSSKKRMANFYSPPPFLWKPCLHNRDKWRGRGETPLSSISDFWVAKKVASSSFATRLFVVKAFFFLFSCVQCPSSSRERKEGKSLVLPFPPDEILHLLTSLPLLLFQLQRLLNDICNRKGKVHAWSEGGGVSPSCQGLSLSLAW